MSNKTKTENTSLPSKSSKNNVNPLTKSKATPRKSYDTSDHNYSTDYPLSDSKYATSTIEELDPLISSDVEKIESTIDKLDPLVSSDVEKIESTLKFDTIEHDSRTRSEIAIVFTKWYFWLLLIVILITIGYNIMILLTYRSTDTLLSLQDGILAISTAIGTPLGFVIGYYFKEGEGSK